MEDAEEKVLAASQIYDLVSQRSFPFLSILIIIFKSFYLIFSIVFNYLIKAINLLDFDSYR